MVILQEVELFISTKLRLILEKGDYMRIFNKEYQSFN